ncbi:aspartate aminotransferase family protein [Pseudogracilibacillus auburnensis]|uniref:aspartate aminotransferase family protein n=1 Tax=Pseudogracilibacillus auburnensis TaxID=1494959 RepID=UPI001A96EF87|nr:aspartate aminotransferase family protein [Pseudogracilibacillus auburnensis]MBO1003729.1 aspartate aminotransferase family protein [Pseudogracilibacillus auburnensis]
MTRTYLIKPILDHTYPLITHGKGIYLYDDQGKKYIDGSSGAVTASIGHGVQEIINAMKEQSEKVSFVYRSQFSTEVAEQLAKKMSDIASGDLNWSFFVNSGSEATETAMKIAIQYWQEKGMKTKTKIISRWMSYHGITMGALSMSGHIDRRKWFETTLKKYPAVSPPYYYRDTNGRSVEQCDEMYAKEFEKEILRVGKDNIAAFIAEPIIGAAGGALTPSDQYFKKMKALCDQYDILFIADEVMTGVGRTGKMFAMEHFDVVPDIMATGKGMSAGYTPIAATVVSEKVMEPILNGSNLIMSGHTFSANPQSAATALAVIEYIENNRLVEKSAEQGAYLRERLEQLAGKSAIIGNIRGKGLFVGIEFVQNKETKQPFARTDQVVSKIVTTNFQEGLLVYPANAGVDGVNGDAVILAPPLIITKTEIDELVDRFARSLAKVEHNLMGKELIQ